jgi:hypothetical protein
VRDFVVRAKAAAPVHRRREEVPIDADSGPYDWQDDQ